MTEADASPELPSSSRGLPSKVPANYDSRSAIRDGSVRVAILVPCFDEALTIANIVNAFKAALPQASIYVYDNNSRDRTAAIARNAGAIVRLERRQGKGHVVRRMFADIDADIYLLVDGDDTYDASIAPVVIRRMIEDGLDFFNVARISTAKEAYRRGHRVGNQALTQIVQSIFGRETSDMLSGYKALSRRFVKSFPAMSSGFETETELTVHVLELRMPTGEIEAGYKERPAGSTSKLRTYRDGLRILMLIFHLVKNERPFQFFGLIGLLFAGIGVALGIPLIATFLSTGLVPRFPTAILSTGLMILGGLSILTSLILDVVAKTRQELKRLAYLQIPRLEGD